MGHYGLAQKVIYLGWEKNRVFVLSHIDLLFCLDLVTLHLFFWLSAVRPRGLPRQQFLYRIGDQSVCFLSCILHLRIFLDLSRRQGPASIFAGWSWKIWRRGWINHIPIDLYDGDLLQKKRKKEDFALLRVLMSDFERACDMRYIR
jgi:hypothetical protein